MAPAFLMDVVVDTARCSLTVAMVFPALLEGSTGPSLDAPVHPRALIEFAALRAGYGIEAVPSAFRRCAPAAWLGDASEPHRFR